MTSKEAFDQLRKLIDSADVPYQQYDELLDAVGEAETAANDERADAFAEGRYATIEKVIE